MTPTDFKAICTTTNIYMIIPVSEDINTPVTEKKYTETRISHYPNFYNVQTKLNLQEVVVLKCS